MANTSKVRSSADKLSFWGMIGKAAKRSRKERPSFIRSWISSMGKGGISLDSRENNYVTTTLGSDDSGSSRIYVIEPKEFNLTGNELETISRVIDSLSRDPPPSSVMDDEISLRRSVEQRASRALSSSGIGESLVLSRVIGQYTVGYGVIEHLLRDERVQDIYIDPPYDSETIRIEIGGMTDPPLNGAYSTNISLTQEEISRLISILRFTSGRPFSEASPVLECDIPLFRSRMTAVSPPLSQRGISIAIRKHSHDPWTLLRLIKAGSLSAEAASFLDLCMSGRSSILIAGPRGAGKSSLLGALLFEMDPEQRLIAIEDTPELPLEQMKTQDLNVVGLTIDSSSKNGAEKALRTALRLGESLLVMGEVRGPETRTLYEAMSAGTAGSAVLGTFHADSAKSVYKRAVEDLNVSPGSFSATDIVVICGVVQPMGKRIRYRRIVQIAEYIKEGPPGNFRDLFLYDPSKDRLEPADDIRGSRTFSRISRLWGMSGVQVIDDWRSREVSFSHVVEVLPDDELSRPETHMQVLSLMKRTREKFNSPPKPDRFLTVFREIFDEEEEEDWIV